MKKHLTYYLLTILCFLTTTVKAQDRVLERMQSSDSIYIFKAKDIDKLLEDNYHWPSIDKLNLSELLAVSAKKDSMPLLPRGNYFVVYKRHDQLTWNLHTVDNYNMRMLTSTKNLELAFYDNNGTPLKNVEVWYKDILYKQDSTTHLVRIENTSKVRENLLVNNNGVEYYYKLNQSKKVLADKHLINVYARSQYTQRHKPYEDEYKRGDTIRLNKRIFPQSFVLFESQYEQVHTTDLANEKTGEIKYIVLDEECEHLKEGNVVKIYLSQSDVKSYGAEFLLDFVYVEQKYKMEAKLNTLKHTRQTTPTLSIRLTEPDNKYSDKDFITIRATTEKTHKAWADSAFVADQLFLDTINVQLNDEIEYTLPAKAFPEADIDYRLEVQLMRNGKMARQERFYLSSCGTTSVFKMKKEGKNIKIEKYSDAKPTTNKAILETYRNKGYEQGMLQDSKEINLPYSESISPNILYYKVIAGELCDSLYVLQGNRDTIRPVDYNLEVVSKDSARIRISNTLDYPIWYSIWYKNKKLKEGYASQAEMMVRNKKTEDYVVDLKYIYGGIFWGIVAPITEPEKFNQPLELPLRMYETGHDLSLYRIYSLEKTEWLKQSMVDEQIQPNKFSPILKDLTVNMKNIYLQKPIVQFRYKKGNVDKPQYLIFVDESEVDAFDKIKVYNYTENKIPVTRNNQSLYVLSNGEQIQKREVKLDQHGVYFLTIDMDKSSDSASLNKEIKKLTDPFSFNNYVKIRVTDTDGYEAIGATVTNRANGQSAVTDVNGDAVLKFPNGFKGEIEVSYIGMKTKIIKYRGEKHLRVVLEENVTLLQNIVIQ